MFKPKYTITNTLATNMRKVGEIVGELNSKALSSTVLMNMERDARALSAHSSTQIEGNPLPLTDVKKIIKSRPEHIRDTEREVLNYNKAMVMLDEQIRTGKVSKLSNHFICQIQSIVIDGLISDSYRGKYRIEPVFVNDPVKSETIYLPPDAKDVEPLMTELVQFINEKEGEIDPLIIAGLFHKQAVIIHPFIDGNGRTTRLITKTLLAELGINTFPLFSFENYYNNNVTKYFQNVGVLGNYYDIAETIDFTQWLEYFTDGIIDELSRVKSQFPQNQVRLERHHRQILEYIKGHGSITMREYKGITDRSKATRILDFKKLVDLRLIEPVGVGKATYYILKTQ
ncbi:Fic family protein [bacterium]|nr:Fic family protein [bacterium]